MNVTSMNTTMKSVYHKNGYTGKDCVVAILDTVIADVGKMKNNIVHMDSYRVNSKNDGNHGTFIANQIFGWAPDATILSYCAFPDGNGKTDVINLALQNIINESKNNPEKKYFVNMSLASNFGRNTISPKYVKMHDLIIECTNNGISVFVAAGNDGTEELYIYPSRFKEPICVGACNSDGSKSDFSTWHDELDFIDEGVSLIGIDQNGIPTIMSGTSMACPNVLGKSVLLSCLLKDKAGRWPTDSELYSELINCSIDREEVGYDKKAGYGFIDIRKSNGIGKELDSEEIPIMFKEQIDSVRKYVCAWIKSFKANIKTLDATMEYTRPLYKNCAPGDDVLYVKKRLTELKDQNSKPYLSKATHSRFLADTDSAVRRYQADNGLKVDGIVGILTWNSLFDIIEDNDGNQEAPDGDFTADSFPDNISQDHIEELIPELNLVSKQRRDFVLHVLQYAADQQNLPEYPLAFYIRGGNLYNKDLTLNVMTEAKLASYFRRADYSQYYDGGRQEMMMEASDEADFNIPGADCSGQVVGWLRFFNLVASGFDANADTLYSRYCVPTKTPKPGDFNWKSGHIGIYIGAGMTVEFVGGAYGAQLTVDVKRKVFNFVTRKTQSFGGWSGYGKPKFFSD